MQKTFIDIPEIKEFAIEHQLMMLEYNRIILYQELIDNLDNSIDEKKKILIRIYVHETKDIDNKINHYRQLLLRK